jgi:hypothetical protein
MIEDLPVRDFAWADPDQFDPQSSGYMAEVDLAYPAELHDAHNQYPLAPETLKITTAMLSPYSRNLAQSQQPTSKLVPHLGPRKNYIVHHKALKFYLANGMTLSKVHRVLSFHEEKWLQPYIDFNTEKRRDATSEFEKNLFKLLNNSVFGKTMENLRKHVSIKLFTSEEKLRKAVCSPRMMGVVQFSDDLVAVKFSKEHIKLVRPIYTGMAILDISKVLMYDFHYHFMIPNLPNHQLLFTDTDSLCYKITHPDIDSVLQRHSHMFDTSNYHRNHPLFSNANKKVLGKMKNEFPTDPITEFVGLRSKLYSIKTVTAESKRAKGVQRCVVANQLTHNNYLSCLHDSSRRMATMHRIGSKLHQLSTVCQHKVALSAYDDKRYYAEDGVASLAYGHHTLPFVFVMFALYLVSY